MVLRVILRVAARVALRVVPPSRSPNSWVTRKLNELLRATSSYFERLSKISILNSSKLWIVLNSSNQLRIDPLSLSMFQVSVWQTVFTHRIIYKFNCLPRCLPWRWVLRFYHWRFSAKSFTAVGLSLMSICACWGSLPSADLSAYCRSSTVVDLCPLRVSCGFLLQVSAYCRLQPTAANHRNSITSKVRNPHHPARRSSKTKPLSDK